MEFLDKSLNNLFSGQITYTDFALIAATAMSEVYSAEEQLADGTTFPVVIKYLKEQIVGEERLLAWLSKLLGRPVQHSEINSTNLLPELSRQLLTTTDYHEAGSVYKRGIVEAVAAFSATEHILARLSDPNELRVLPPHRLLFLPEPAFSGKTLYRLALVVPKLPEKSVNLAQYIESQKDLPLPDKLLLLSNIAEELAKLWWQLNEMHRLKVYHRDIKLENIMLVHTPDGFKLVLIDFGLALINDQTNHQSQGTPYAVAPEPFIGRPWSGRSDQFSTFATLAALISKLLVDSEHFLARQKFKDPLLELMFPQGDIETLVEYLPEFTARLIQSIAEANHSLPALPATAIADILAQGLNWTPAARHADPASALRDIAQNFRELA